MSAPTTIEVSGPHRPLADVLGTFVVDRASPIPLWFQVAQHLERSIATGVLPQGALLDNEIAMAERLGISRPTMRRAMEELVGQGLIVRRRGIGTTTSPTPVRSPRPPSCGSTPCPPTRRSRPGSGWPPAPRSSTSNGCGAHTSCRSPG
jgi:DNA-binding transcriptional MocR family regulator